MADCRTVRIHSFGGPEVLQLDTVPVPEPRGDEVLICVQAASVNPVDYKIRQGGYPAVKAEQLPLTLGRDASGVVEKCGPQAGAREGDEVFVFSAPELGTYTECLLAKPAGVAPKPRTLDHIHAAAVPVAGTTAWQGLFDHGGLKAGQRVLIHGGTGGVGHFAVQFAKAKGAYVLTTAGAESLDFARLLGADEVIDYKAQRFEEVARDIVVVFDLIGGETQERSWSVLKPGGIIVSTLQEPSKEQASKHRSRGTRYTATPNSEQLRAMAELIDQGKVRVEVAKVFGLDEVREAHRTLENGSIRGKVVLRI